MKETSRGDYKKDHVKNNPKTIQAIGCMMFLIENKLAKKVLILCKKSLKFQWESEIEKFTNYNMDNVLIIDGNSKKKEKIYDEFIELDEGILISNYDVVVSAMDVEKLNSIKPQLLIIDEAHVLRGANTLKNTEISKISKDINFKIFLTGTPMASRPDDLFGIMKMADAKFFGSEKNFKAKYLTEEPNKFSYNQKRTVGYKRLDELEEITHSMMIRRTEKEVELDLPEILPPNRIYLDMDKTQKKIFQAIEEEKQMIGAVSQSCDENIQKLIKLPQTKENADRLRKFKEQKEKANNYMIGLRAYSQTTANDPRIIYKAPEKVIEKYGSLIPKNYDLSPKTQALLDIVEGIVKADEKAIIFTQYERSVFQLQEDITKLLKINVVIYTGSVNSEDRKKNIKEFTTNDEVNVIVMTSAGQEGEHCLCPYITNCEKLLRA